MNLSEPFRATNGVRHRGVLSPYLFPVYLDDLSKVHAELHEIVFNCSKTVCIACKARPQNARSFRC